MANILFVSKPVAPPWNDSSKNLVWELARALARHTPVVMSRAPRAIELPRGSVEFVYGAARSNYAPALRDNARVLGHLLLGARRDLWHFFFAPNAKSSAMGRLASRVRRVPTVHTVCSAPSRDAHIRSLLFADVTVVLSRHTEERLLAAGVPAARLRRIAPAIAPLVAPEVHALERHRTELSLPSTDPILIFPGDLEFGRGAQHAIDALSVLPGVHLIMACRAKTARALHAEAALRDRAVEKGVDQRVRWVGEVSHIHQLLALADVVLLPTEDLFAKMDYPLVVLEAMGLGKPVIVARGTPAAELAEGGAVVAVEPSGEAVAAAVETLLERPDERADLGTRAKHAIATDFSPARMSGEYERLYDDLVGL